MTLPQRLLPTIERLKRKERLAFLKQRRIESRLAGFKGKKQLNLKAANEFFDKRYGISYADLAYQMGRSVLYDITKTLELQSACNQTQKHLIVFPLIGSLFNYYFARGVLSQMRLEGKGKNIKLATIVPMIGNSKAEKRFDEKTGENKIHAGSLDKYALKIIKPQMEKLFRKEKIGGGTMIDYVSQGRTFALLGKEFKKAFTEQKIKGNLQPEFHGLHTAAEHQVLRIKGQAITPESLVVKFNQFYALPSKLSLATKESAALRAKARELLFYLGRAYYSLEKKAIQKNL
ncbi:hypothetical protein HZB89_02185 [archaeon]|nr:hypothetical protein [archaeon]